MSHVPFFRSFDQTETRDKLFVLGPGDPWLIVVQLGSFFRTLNELLELTFLSLFLVPLTSRVL